MTDRESVIAGLEDSLANNGCGFMDGIGELFAVSGEDLRNAIDLLKAQEPRVLSIGEMLWFDGPFLIEYNQSVYSHEMCWAMFGYFDENQVYIRCQNRIEHYAIAQYGVTWRCWNIRPSQEEMEAMPWNG